MASLLFALLSTIPACAALQTSGTFNILSFNVAGLPAILNSNDVPGDKTTNTASIGQKFAQYNYSLIHVQEDFNYHATLYANDDHPYRTATSGGVPFGSGLNTISNFDWIDFERTKWAVCSDASQNDCLTPKGFTFMRAKVSEGVWVDVYNLHADAGTEPDDITARASNLQQVSDHIMTYSAGNPVLVFGDTNSRYTRAGDIPTIFTTANGMTDPWVELIHGGEPPTVESLCDNPSPNNTCEIVDKVWYRGSATLNLNATSFDYVGEKFLQADGNVLSDHDPVLVEYEWTLGSTLRLSDPFGGPHGDWYSDLDVIASTPNPAVASITLAGGNRLDSVSVTLTSGQTFTHGGTGGTASTLTLNSGEELVGATLCEGKYNDETKVFYAQITTSSGRNVIAGKLTSDCATRSVESGWGIVGFVGRSGDEVDRLGFVYAKA
ncbi:endonuclease/exonuclease/phosphatase family protein-like protein [Lophiotrema nucula]|uniref:Endonuclease/exonuclease/phosphatase family protein-like protein n=1 Tax=Lophiotrema nucula TaxID=690887 RepID=A0A6A5ZB51_9PLEO|nr:endonuclease/exonuclease/phosphatase family protein-like protein [Lophiotrema nucula]